MSRWIAPEIYRFIQDRNPDKEVVQLTVQQEQGVMYYLRGMAMNQAAKAAGYSSVGAFRNMIAGDPAQAVISYMQEQQLDGIRISLEVLNAMTLEAHRKAATAGEEIQAIKLLADMNGVMPNKKSNSGVTLNQTIQMTSNPDGSQSVTQAVIAGKTDEELIALAGQGFDFRLDSPKQIIEDVEWVEE